MKIEIKNKKVETPEDFIGKVILLDDEPNLLTRTSYSKCYLISLQDGNRISDTALEYDSLSHRSIVEYARSLDITKTCFLEESQYKLVISLEE